MLKNELSGVSDDVSSVGDVVVGMSALVAVQLVCYRIRKGNRGECGWQYVPEWRSWGRYWVPDKSAVWVLTVTEEGSRWE